MGQYLYVGDVILDGGTPYVDAANNKGPALYLLSALIRLVAGTSPVAVRVVVLLLVVLAALALAAYVARYAGRATGFLAGALLAAITAAPDVNGGDPYAEQLGLAPMMGALWLASRPGWPSRLGSGVLVAFAALMHPVFAIAVPFVALELWHSAGPGGRRRAFAAATLGALAIVLPVLGWIAAAGALDEMAAQSLGQVGEAIAVGQRQAAGRSGTGCRGRAWEWRRDRLPAGRPAVPRRSFRGRVLGFQLPWLTLLALIGSAVALRGPHRRLAIGAMLWIALCWARGAASAYDFAHHYTIAIPGIAVGIALGLAFAWALLSRPAYRLAAIAPLAVLLWLAVFAPALGSIAPGAPLAGTDYSGGNPGFEQEAEFVRTYTEPGDEILSLRPEVYWLSERRAPTRFFDLYEARDSAANARERERDLLENPPAALVLRATTEEDLADFGRLIERHDYELATSTSTSVVLLRKDRARQAARAESGR